MSDLPIHVMPEEDSDSLDIDLEVIDDMISSDLILREEIEERMANYKTGLEALYVLEDYHSAMYSKEFIDDRDIKQLNLITKAININLNYKYDGFNVATEGLSDLVKSSSESTVAVAKKAVAVGGKAAGPHTPDLFKHPGLDIMRGLTGERGNGQHQLPYLSRGQLVQGIDIGVVKHGDQYR